MGKITTLTPEELAMVAKKPSEEAIEAVEKTGDQDALEKVKQLASMAAAKDLMVRGWVTEALSMLYKKCGPDPVREVWMNCFLPMFKADPDSFWNSSFHDRVLSCINGLLRHDALRLRPTAYGVRHLQRNVCVLRRGPHYRRAESLPHLLHPQPRSGLGPDRGVRIPAECDGVPGKCGNLLLHLCDLSAQRGHPRKVLHQTRLEEARLNRARQAFIKVNQTEE